MQTPWGQSDRVEQVAEGIQFVSTPSHGGIKLSAARLAKMPTAVLDSTFSQLGHQGWFEEDCDWALVVVQFPNEFPPAEVDLAREMIQYRNR